MDEVSRGPRSWLWANNENFNNRRTKNNNQGQAGDPMRPVSPLVGEESIAAPAKASSGQGSVDLAEEIMNFFTRDDANFNATVGTNVLLSEGFQGVDPLIALKDCSCKSPLLDALKKQTEALVKEKESHETTLAKRVVSEREAVSLRSQISDFVERERQLTTDKNELDAVVQQLKAELEAKSEAARNTDIVIERIRSELVAKLSELAREVQRGNKAEADVALLEEQVENLQRQVSDYDTERQSLERGRTDLQSRFVEGIARLKTLKMESNMEKDELMQKITLMREQVRVMSQQKTKAEQECRSYREGVEALTAAATKDKNQIRNLEEALTLEETRREEATAGLKSEIARLEKLVRDIKAEAVAEMTGLDRSRGQCNNLLMRATKEIAHLDQTTEDMRKHLDAINNECQSLKEEKKAIEEDAKANEEKWIHEREKLLYEINRLGKVSAEMDEGRNEAEIKILELQNELGDAENLLRIRQDEKEQLEEAMEKRTESLNNALMRATEAMRADLEDVKAALKAKSTELQNLKASVNLAGGDVSLMPLDREDYQRTVRESEELKRENDSLKEELIRSSARESVLQSELEEATGEEEIVAAALEEHEGREARLTGDLMALQGQLDEMKEALASAEDEALKLTTILKEQLAAAPINIEAELYQKNVAKKEEANEHENRAADNDEPMTSAPMAGGGGGGGAGSNGRNSLNNLAHQLRVARNYQMQKGMNEAMQRVGLDNEELSELAKNYEGEHLDFNKILEEVLHKAQKYRAERNALASQVKEFKVELHFLKLELNLYKELEIKMKNLGGIDDEALKNAKVDIAEKMAKETPKDLDPDVAAALAGGKAGDQYGKSSIVKMTTMFSEQKHILDMADAFRSLDDLLKALREDVVAETTALKKELASLIRLVDGLNGDVNVHAVGGNVGACMDYKKDDYNDDDDGAGSVQQAVESEQVSLEENAPPQQNANWEESVGRGKRSAAGSERSSVAKKSLSSRQSGQSQRESVKNANRSMAGVKNTFTSRQSQKGSVNRSEVGVEDTSTSWQSQRGSVNQSEYTSTSRQSQRGSVNQSEAVVEYSSTSRQSLQRDVENANRQSAGSVMSRTSQRSGSSVKNSSSRQSGSRKIPASERMEDDADEAVVERDQDASAVNEVMKSSEVEDGQMVAASSSGAELASSLASKSQTPPRNSSRFSFNTDQQRLPIVERQSATPPAENETDQSNNAVIPRRQQRVDFRLPPAAPRDSNENNLAGRFKEFGAASWTDERGFMTNDKTRRRLIEEDSLEEVNETDVSDEGEAAIKMKNGNDIAGKRQMTREEERLKDHPASRRNNLPPPVLERGRDGEEDDVGSLRGSDGASSRYGPRHRQQQQHPQRPREVDEEGNVWTTDEAGRRWIVDQAGRQWRLGLDERQYMIDVEGVKWTVEEVDGRRRRWRRNAKGDYIYAEEDGVEWVVAAAAEEGGVAAVGGGAGYARRMDEEGNLVMKDGEGVEWILDEVGRGWRENEKGQILLLDREGRVWKFDEETAGKGGAFEFGRRRDALGQKWLIDLHGAVWLLADDRKGWRVDSNMNILAVETTANGAAASTRGEGRGWLMERSTGIQWLVDKNRRRLRAARKDETLTIPPEVKLALKADFASTSTKEAKTDSDDIDFREKVSVKRKSGGGSKRGGRGGRDRAGSWEMAESDDAESILSNSSLEMEESRKRRKRSTREWESFSTHSSLARTPSQLRAKAAKLRTAVAARQAHQSQKNDNNNVVDNEEDKIEKENRPTYHGSTWGL